MLGLFLEGVVNKVKWQSIATLSSLLPVLNELYIKLAEAEERDGWG